MAQENITVKLPGCGGEAIIRPFVKNKDRRAIRRAVMASKEFSQQELEAAGDDDGNMSFTIKGNDLNDVMDVKVKCLLLSYDGNTDDPFNAMNESEYEEDMNAVEEAIKTVFDKEDEKNSEKKSKAGKQPTTAQ